MSLFVAKKLVIYQSTMVALMSARRESENIDPASVSYLNLPKREERKQG